MDVLRVTGGQDHGARFGLRGSEATIGRGPVMDIVLSDPRVSRRHARLAVRDAALVVEDLASSGGTTVNGVTIVGPTALAPGDRIGLGTTELTVLWTPGVAPSPPPPGPARRDAVSAPGPIGREVEVQLDHPAPAPSPSAVEPAGEDAVSGPRPLGHEAEVQLDHPAPPPSKAHAVARPEVLLPIACLALAVFALVGVWMPVLGTASGTDSLWTLDSTGFRVHGLAAALVSAAAAAGWLASVVVPGLGAARVGLTAATGLGGGLVAGLPLFLAAVDLRGVGVEAGLVLLALAGTAIAACAVAGVAQATARARPARAGVAPVVVLAAGGGIGGVLALVASPLTWVSSPVVELGGFDEGFRAGGWLVPLALAVASASALTLAVSRTGEARAAMCVAVVAGAVSGAAFAFVNGAAIGFSDLQAGIGLGLAMTGTAVAVTTIAIGGAAMALRWGPTR